MSAEGASDGAAPARPLRVMQIVSGTEVNGAVVHCLQLSRALAARGHAVTVVCRPDSWIASQLGDGPLPVVTSQLTRFPPRELRRIAAVVRDAGIDVVHTHMSRAHFFGVLLRRWCGVPCVATAHSTTLQLHWMFNDAVIAVSEATRRYQQRRNLVRAGRIQTIHTFVDQAHVAAASPGDGAAVCAELGIEPGALVVGTVGAVIPRKGITDLVRAWPAVRAAQPQARLLIAGDEPEGHADVCRALAQRLGVADAIIWAGRRADVARILAALDVFVLASRVEPFGLAAAEAMAAGLPVVATAVGGLPECVSDGETGVLVPPSDPPALAAALVALLGDPLRRRQLGVAGRQRVAARFAAEVQVPRIEAVLRRVAISAARQ